MASVNRTVEQPDNRLKRSQRRREEERCWSLILVDVGIAAALLVVPFSMGGRTPAGQLAFACVAFWTAFWWLIHQILGKGYGNWHNTLAFLPMALGVGVALLQILPLTPSVISWLSPQIYETLPLWSPGDNGQITLGTWQFLSLAPETTRQSLPLLVSGVLLFVVTVQRIQRVDDVERIIRWLAISASVMAAFGILQFLTSNGKFFWFYGQPYSSTDGCAKGAFTNRNHFAQFIALGFGALLWWVYGTGTRQPRSHSSYGDFRPQRASTSLNSALKTLLVPLCALAVLMSFSRGGVLALLVSCVTALFLLLNAGKMSRKTFAILAGTGLITCLGLSIYGYEALSTRFESAKSLESLGDRSRLWGAAIDGLQDHILLGTGLTSHQDVYPMYLTPAPGDSTNIFYTHAENGYIQLVLETGVIGLTLALVVLGYYFFWCVASLASGGSGRSALCFVAILPALLANSVHSCMDFVWYVPSCMGVVAILGACACRLFQLERERMGCAVSQWHLPRFAWAGMALGLLGLSLVSIPVLWQAFRADAAWNRYLALRQTLAKLNRSTAYDEILAASESRKEILAAEANELASVLQARPDWPEAHACKAQVHRDLFHEFQATSNNGFDLRMIRETVRDNFESVDAAREWLPRGIGEHYVHLEAALRHGHRALELAPLQGEVYLLLAQLAFLESTPVPSRPAYTAQAFRVRPHEGAVLFEIGSEMTLAGRPDQALKYLKRSFARGAEHQTRLIQMLAGSVPVESFLREFQPDADAMQILVDLYQRPELEGELGQVLIAHATECEAKAMELGRGKDAAKYWFRAASSHERLGNVARQSNCLEHAVAVNSTDFDVRYALGRVHLTLGEFAEAERQFRWCVQRKPGHPKAEHLLEKAVRQRIASSPAGNPLHQAGLRREGVRR